MIMILSGMVWQTEPPWQLCWELTPSRPDNAYSVEVHAAVQFFWRVSPPTTPLLCPSVSIGRRSLIT